jgi:hypothetical protein
MIQLVVPRTHAVPSPTIVVINHTRTREVANGPMCEARERTAERYVAGHCEMEKTRARKGGPIMEQAGE